ncbi:hypothetical protein DSO57_1001845 [Entomophthora muscae]|uniref:Uncharacterized protein n=1 Tax=Entomophthora muscae TaxID=34485 RepID=A0ACC2SXT3_9FUNG|nr:hypothetical protein DSO57_1001845 [Entomophthora muscae]
MIFQAFQVLLAPSESSHLLSFFLTKLDPIIVISKESKDELTFGLSNTRGFCDASKQSYYMKTFITLKFDLLFITDVNIQKTGSSLHSQLGADPWDSSRFTDKVGLLIFNELITKYTLHLKNLAAED